MLDAAEPAHFFCRAPKRSAPSSAKSTPVKKGKHETQEEPEHQSYSFKNQAYFDGKAGKKWKNLKQILDMPVSAIGPEGAEFFTCRSLI